MKAPSPSYRAVPYTITARHIVQVAAPQRGGTRRAGLDPRAADFIEQIREAAWDAEYVWASWIDDTFQLACYPPEPIRDSALIESLALRFSHCKNHENLAWQKVWENTQEVN